MKYLVATGLGLIIVGSVAVFVFLNRQTISEPIPVSISRVTDPKNATYRIEGEIVTLTNGESIVAVSDAASVVTTRYFGNEITKDLNGDGRDDSAFILTQEQGASGTFFYVAAALSTAAGYVGTEALFLGDRIAPQAIESGPDRQIIVNYAERAPGEPFSTAPSVGKSIRLLLEPATLQFSEVVTDFEGEVDPRVLTLGMKTWVWERATYNDGREILPIQAESFTLLFADDGTLNIGTDCNSGAGRYETANEKITFSELRSTMKYCEGSQESIFLQLLTDTNSFHFTDRGRLVFDLKFDSGSVVFK